MRNDLERLLNLGPDFENLKTDHLSKLRDLMDSAMEDICRGEISRTRGIYKITEKLNPSCKVVLYCGTDVTAARIAFHGSNTENKTFEVLDDSKLPATEPGEFRYGTPENIATDAVSAEVEEVDSLQPYSSERLKSTRKETAE